LIAVREALRFLVVAAGCVALACAAASAAEPAPVPELTASQIVAKNALARGGLEAWGKIQSMVWVGHVESAEVPGHNMPFMLEQQRPNSTRFELVAQNQRSVRIYDGTSGWKLRPGNGGIPELQPYSEEELGFARDAQAIDGPLMHDIARGAAITLIGVEEFEGRKSYALRATLPMGAAHRVWVDAETFLETRYERDIRNAAGQTGTASVRYRDYQAFQGLQLPTIIETTSASGEAANRLVIEKFALNPPLDPRMFSKPNAPTKRHHGVTVDTRKPPAAATPPAAPHP
jgi:hypothetical protein